MPARPIHVEYARLPWLIAAMTVIVLAIGALAAWNVEPGLAASAPVRSLVWKLAAAWMLVLLPIVGFLFWSAIRLKKERESAEAAESRYRRLVEQATDIIYQVDLNGYFTYVNPTVTRYKSYSPDELIGRHFTEHIRPDAREAATRFYMRQFARRTPSTYYEFPVIKKDGGEIWFGQHVQLLIENGQVVGFQAVARDITERKNTERVLRDSEHRYKTLFATASDAIFLIAAEGDEVGRILDVNRAAAEMHGYTQEELLAMRITDLDTPASAKEAPGRIRELLAGKHLTFSVEHRRRDGTVFPIEVTACLIEIRNRRCILAFDRDISDRKKAEEALRSTTEFLQTLIQTSPLAIINLDPESNVVSWNRAAEEMLGWSESEVLGKPLPYVPPGKEAEADAVWSESLHGPGVSGVEIRRRKKDGTPIDLAVWSRTIRNSQGSVVSSLGILVDITERKKVEEVLEKNRWQLRESEARYRNLFEYNPLMYFMLDAEGTVVSVNPKGAAQLGYTIPDLTGRPVSAVFPKDVHGAVRNQLDTCLRESDRVHTWEITKLRKDGALLWVRETAVTIRDEHGHPLILIMCEDITERKQAEEALRDSERRFRTIFHQAPLGIAVIESTTGRFLQVNQTYCGIVGLSPEEMLDRGFQDITHPDDLQTDLDNMKRLMDGQISTFRMEKRYIRKDGAVVWVNLVCVPLWWGGDTRHRLHLAMVEDITERKRVEEEVQRARAFLGSVVDNIPDMVFVKDAKDLRFVQLNKAGEELLGYRRQDLIGRTDYDLFPKEEADFFTGKDRTVLASKQLLDISEEPIQTKDRGTRILHTKKIPILDKEGTPQYLLGISEDITERKQAEQRLHERSRQQAIEAELSLLAVTTRDVASLLSTAAGLVLNALDVNYCETLELPPNGAGLRLCASAGWRGDEIGQVRALETGSLAHAALNANKPVVRTLLKESTFGGPRWLHEHGVVTGMSVNIPGKDGAWGVLCVYTTATRPFSRDDVNFLQTVSSILGTTIERMQTESVLRSANQSLRLLSRQLLQVQEEERRMIARDLHDEIGQSLTAIKLNVERAQRTADRDARARIMRDCAQVTERVLDQVRSLSLDLHPSILDDLGLAYAIKWFADRQAERAGLKVELSADPSLPRLPHDMEIACYRIAQEALTNVVRHAHAGNVGITLKREGAAVELCVQDDGIGFIVGGSRAESRASVGLASMQERAKLLGGTVRITSTPHCGTTVVATLPLPVRPQAETPSEQTR